MAGIAIEDGSKQVQVVELGLIAAKQQAIFGSSDRDLILRTAGNIKIQAAGKFYDLPFVTDNGDTSEALTLTVVADVTQLGSLVYPGDGKFVYVQSTKAFYLTNDNNYVLVYEPPTDVDVKYLSYSDTQNLTGSQKLIAANNLGNFIGQIADVNTYGLGSIYENQLLYSLTEGKHFRLTNKDNPSAVSSWKELYMPIGGGTISGGLHLDSEYAFNRLTSPTLQDPILSIGSPDFTKGLATWSNDSNVYLQSLAPNSLRGFNFLTTANDGTIGTPFTILNNLVGVNGTDPKYNFNVNGTAGFQGISTFTTTLQSSDFLKGTGGVGWAISKDSSGEWSLEVDDLIVRNQHNNVNYQTFGLNGSQIYNYDIRVIEADLVEEIPVYIRASSSGRYLNNTGTIRELNTRNTYVNVKSIPIADLNTPSDTPIQSLNFIKLSYAIGDRDSGGVVDTSTTFSKVSDGTYYTPVGTTSYNGTDFVPDPSGDLVLINTIGVYFIRSTSQSLIKVGDLLYYKQWDDEKFFRTGIHVEVVALASDGYYVYAYDNPAIDNTFTFVKIGNTDGTGAMIQTNAADLASPSTEVLSQITSFRSFYENFYYSVGTDFIEFDDLPEDSWIDKANTRVKLGDLSNITDTDLQLSTTQYGLYSDNVFLKGNYVLNSAVFNNIPTVTGYNNFLMLNNHKMEQIDLTTEINHWDQAYSWGNHALAGYAFKATTITATAPGITGGGDLSANRTFALDFAYLDGRFGTAQIQSDWNQTDNTLPDFIKNKPTIIGSQDLQSVTDNGSVTTNSITASAFFQTSLRELKDNIVPYNKSCLNLINNMRVREFNFKGYKQKHIGFIVDEIVEDNPEILNTEYNSISIPSLVAQQAKAIQELTNMVEELKWQLGHR